MFTRSRNGRRGPPARLDVERLEARVLLHNSPLTAGLAAPAPPLPAVVVRPLPDGLSLGHGHADSQAGDLFASSDTGKHADKGQGNGGVPGDHGRGLSALAGGLGDDLASGKHGHGHQDVLSDDDQEKDSGSGDKGHGAARKGHGTSDDDAGPGRLSSEDASSAAPLGRGAVFHADTGQIQLTTVLRGESTGASPRAAVGGELADEVVEGPSPVGAIPLAATAEGGGTPAPAQSAAAVTSAPGAPLPVPGREAAPQDKGDNSATGAAQAAAQAAGTAAVLALLAARPASSAPPSGQGAAAPAVAVTGPALAVTGPADVRLLRGGALAEAAAPGGDAPAAVLGPFPAFAAPLAGVLLERLAPDTRALDAALQGFLHGLDRLGEPLAGPRSRLGVTAWVLTGVAALTALEWDRRRRAAAASSHEVPLSWLDPGGPAL